MNALTKNSMMLLLTATVLLIIPGCSHRTQAGTMRTSDMRPWLPGEIRKFETRPSLISRYSQQIKVAPQSALITINWRTLDLAEGKYLLAVTTILDAPVSYDLLNVSEPTRP